MSTVPQSLLAADIGTVWTRVLLVDRVDEAYRFVASGEAPTTAGAPHKDVRVGLRVAISKIERITGREFLDPKGGLISPEDATGRGIDRLVLSCSAAEPLRVVVGGLVDALSVQSAARAAHGSYSELLARLALNDARGRWGDERGIDGVIERLDALEPEVILIAGGTEESVDHDLLELIGGIATVFEAATPERRPHVIYAGSALLREEVEQRLKDTSFEVVPNLRPTLHHERTRPASEPLDTRFRARHLGAIDGLDAAAAWSGDGVLPTAETLGRVTQFLAMRDQLRVLAVDVGGGQTTVSIALPDGRSQTVIRPDLGLARAPEALVEHLGRETIAAWVPEGVPPREVVDEYLNLQRFPRQSPTRALAHLAIEAVARESIRLTLAEALGGWEFGDEGLARMDLIIGSGGPLRESGRPERALAMLLDGITPVGIARVVRDRVGLIPAAGAIAGVAPEAAANLLAAQEFEPLALVVSPVGGSEPGEELVRFRIDLGGAVTEGSVEHGELLRLPTPVDTIVTIRPLPHVDIGRGPGEGRELRLAGEQVGLIIDGRGRPLPRDGSLDARRRRSEEWRRYVGL